MIEIDDLFYIVNHKKPGERCIIKNFSLSIKKHEFIVLAGNNGCGKSSLFKVLTGEAKASFGQVTFKDKDLLKMDRYMRAKYIAYLEEDIERGLCPDLSVLENLVLADLRSKPKLIYRSALSKQIVDKMIEIVSRVKIGLEDDIYKYVRELPLLKQHAVYLLMLTLDSESELILIDEHLADLDPESAKKLLALMAKIIREKELTVIMSTHNPYLALKLGTRTVIMNSGEIVFDSNVNKEEKLTPQQILMYFNKHFFI